jgi:glycosyltransferase involved in cell wall biosynthesis
MAVGVPVITCAIGGIPESIKNYSNKTVVATRNPKLLSLSMKEAILQKSEGRVRRKRLTEHSLDSMYESVLKVYKSAIQQSICG